MQVSARNKKGSHVCATYIPQIGQHGHASAVDGHCGRILVLVHEVDGRALGQQSSGLVGHGNVHKRGQVQRGAAIQAELIVDNLIGLPARAALFGQVVLWQLRDAVTASMIVRRAGCGVTAYERHMRVVSSRLHKCIGVDMAGEGHGGGLRFGSGARTGWQGRRKGRAEARRATLR